MSRELLGRGDAITPLARERSLDLINALRWALGEEALPLQCRQCPQ
jgi:hypothetical protein